MQATASCTIEYVPSQAGPGKQQRKQTQQKDLLHHTRAHTRVHTQAHIRTQCMKAFMTVWLR